MTDVSGDVKTAANDDNEMLNQICVFPTKSYSILLDLDHCQVEQCLRITEMLTHLYNILTSFLSVP